VKRNRGFTLPETLVATAILVSGLAGVAWVFSMSVSANLANRHRASAALLASAKLEEFEGAPHSDPRWKSGGGLDPAFPVPGYFDVVASGGSSYLRVWEISGTAARTIHVAVYPQGAALPARQPPAALIHVSTTNAPGF
jgi:prepilin-type N-terminal cleavage/methylation domain-containing protein